MPTDEIEAIVAEIVEGTYKRRSSAASVPEEKGDSEVYTGSGGSEFSQYRVINAAVSAMTNDFNDVIIRIENGDTRGLKAALRDLIASLDGLYNSIL